MDGIVLLVGDTGRPGFVTRFECLRAPLLSAEDKPVKIELELEFRLQIVGQTSGVHVRAGGVFLRTCRMYHGTLVVGEGRACKN